MLQKKGVTVTHMKYAKTIKKALRVDRIVMKDLALHLLIEQQGTEVLHKKMLVPMLFKNLDFIYKFEYDDRGTLVCHTFKADWFMNMIVDVIFLNGLHLHLNMKNIDTVFGLAGAAAFNTLSYFRKGWEGFPNILSVLAIPSKLVFPTYITHYLSLHGRMANEAPSGFGPLWVGLCEIWVCPAAIRVNYMFSVQIPNQMS
ncbi:hypothetical protein EV424DRAFT_1343302 [Suillus variegatus]|nr:hypothetical protein EV424DRAFT_1343302 [Suillus variegatus]